jgi:AcrR family transcriptional regulator
VSPRAYSMEKRGAAAAETRQRILGAARELLAQGVDAELSMDAIARRADVSRLTIYYHFTSRAGLLEAVLDSLRERGNMQRVDDVFRDPDPRVGLTKLIHTLVRFWSTEPHIIRRLRAMAVLDAEIAKGVRSRDDRRRRAIRDLLRRITKGRTATPRARGQNLAADVLCAVISFETYDALAAAGHSREEIAVTITDLAECAVRTLQ